MIDIVLKEMLYEVRYLKSNDDMILTLTGQFKQLSHEPENFQVTMSPEIVQVHEAIA